MHPGRRTAPKNPAGSGQPQRPAPAGASRAAGALAGRELPTTAAFWSFSSPKSSLQRCCSLKLTPGSCKRSAALGSGSHSLLLGGTGPAWHTQLWSERNRPQAAPQLLGHRSPPGPHPSLENTQIHGVKSFATAEGNAGSSRKPLSPAVTVMLPARAGFPRVRCSSPRM